MGVPILTIVFAGLVGGILWNLVTWLSAFRRALARPVRRADRRAIAALGLGGVKWDGVFSSVVIPAVLAPVVAALVAAIGTRLIYRIIPACPRNARRAGFRWGQIGPPRWSRWPTAPTTPRRRWA